MSDQDLQTLRLVVSNRPDAEICDNMTRSDGIAPAEAQYAVAAARQRMNDLVKQAQPRLTSEAVPFSVAQQLATETGLPSDLAEQIVARAVKQNEQVAQKKSEEKHERYARWPAGVIGAVVAVIVFIKTHASTQDAYFFFIVTFIVVGVLASFVLQAIHSWRRKV